MHVWIVIVCEEILWHSGNLAVNNDNSSRGNKKVKVGESVKLAICSLVHWRWWWWWWWHWWQLWRGAVGDERSRSKSQYMQDANEKV